jgi:hypothetical protein
LHNMLRFAYSFTYSVALTSSLPRGATYDERLIIGT